MRNYLTYDLPHSITRIEVCSIETELLDVKPTKILDLIKNEWRCQKTWLKELSDSIISFFISKMCVVLCWSFECDRCSLILLETNVGNLIRRMLFPTSQTSKFLLQHACTLNFYLAIHLIPRLTLQHYKYTTQFI